MIIIIISQHFIYSMPPTKKTEARHWCFTHFDLTKTPEDVFNILSCRFAAMQLETCPTTLKGHY